MIEDLKITAVAAPVREEVVRRLREAILSGRFRPGDRLIERELVEWTGVSRTSIREALRQLESEGLVTVVPSRGPVVTVLTEETAKQIYEVRAVLEGFAAKQFALRAADETRRRLAASVDAMAAIVEEGGTLLHEKSSFYEILFSGAGNEVAWSLFGSLYARIALLRATTLSAPGRPPQTIRELREILTAIEAHDGNTAELATIRHVEEAAQMAIRCLHTQAKANTRSQSARRETRTSPMWGGLDTCGWSPKGGCRIPAVLAGDSATVGLGTPVSPAVG